MTAAKTCESVPSGRPRAKPRRLIEDSNPDRTVAALRDALAAAGGLYERGLPVRLAFDQMQQGAEAEVMTPDALVLTAHTLCRPYGRAGRRAGGGLDEVTRP